MNDVQTNRTGRNDKVAGFIQDQVTNLTATPNMNAVYLPAINTEMDAVIENDNLATQDTTGHAEKKGDERDTLESETFHVANGLAAYAHDKDDLALQSMVECTATDLSGMRGYKLLEFSKFVQKKVKDTTIAAALVAKHNVSAKDITDFGSSITAFDEIFSQPQINIAEKVAYGKMVDIHLDNIDKILDKIRREMRSYKKTNRLLYETFLAIDKIDDYGHGGGETPPLATPIPTKPNI